jgi:WD40 repeat protein/tRNA A-37 threonylcarbamoyl transferase component Bud32
VREPPRSDFGALPPALGRLVDQACNRFEAAWRSGVRPRIEDYLADMEGPFRTTLLRELVLLEVHYRRRGGEAPQPEDYAGRFPELDPAWLAEALGEGAGQIPSAPPDSTRAALPPTVSAEPPRPAPGDDTPQRIGDYEVLGEIAHGGMGVVYKARQRGLDRVVALKMIVSGGRARDEDRRRFRAEGEAVARLRHPNVVQVYEVGEHDGRPYLTMEYCDGGSLDAQLDGTPWQPAKAAALVQTLAHAMQAAHAAGVVHRDLKPANVLLAADGTPKVSDFGLAKRLDVAGQTQTGAVMGTPSYMAPEQAEGHKDVGPAADIWALGAILYELLTGRPPFKGASVLETLEQVRTREPVTVRQLQPGVPRDLETVCHHSLHKDPRKRYASAAALAEDLRRFGAGEPVAARPVSAVGRAVRWARRRPAVAGLLVTVALVAAAGLGGILWAYGEAVRQRDLARDESARADEQAAEAKRETAEARRQEYFAQIGRAEAQLQAGDHAGAAGVLERVGPEYRSTWEYGYLRRRTEGTPLTLCGHTDGVSSVAYSPDGTRLASASWDQTIKLWDTRTGAELATLRGGGGPVCYSPDGTRLASASGSEVKLWDTRRGAEIATLRGHTGEVRSVVYSPDSTRLASASGDNTVKLWDATSGAAIATLRGHTLRVTSVAYSSDGTRLASASYDNTVKLWDAISGAAIVTLRGGGGPVCYSPDGTRLASASGSEVKLWDARRGAEVATLRGHTDQITSVAYSPDGTWLATASRDNTLKLWDGRSGAAVGTLGGHTGWVSSVCYSPDGTRLASASYDQTVKLWDARSETLIATVRGGGGPVRYSPDGTRLVSFGAEGVKVWDTRSGAKIATLRGLTGGVTGAAYSPDGTRLACAAGGGAKVWDARSGAELASLHGYASRVRSVAYSPDGTRIAGAAGEFNKPGEVKVWDAHSGAEITSLRGHTNMVTAVVYSPDGTRLASASHDHTVKLWDAHSGADLATLRGHTDQVFAVAYSPDGTHLASAAQDKTIKVWDATSGAEIATLRGHTGEVTSVVYSPNGTRIASASFDRTVKVWDAHSGAEIATLPGHTGYARSVCYSPDATRLVSSDRDGHILVWDSATGKHLPGEVPGQGLTTDNVSPDGAAVGVPDGHLIRLWPRRPLPGGYDLWAESHHRRTALAPTWHAEDADTAEKAGDAFAAAFHRRQLAEGDNLRLLAWSKLAAGDELACRRAIAMLHQQHRLVAALACAGPLFATLAAGPAPVLCSLAAASPLEAEHRRVAAQLVQAAAVLAESGVPAAELVTLARCCTVAEPQGWQARELLGAALYRDGRAAEAVRELEEAVRRHGAGGSLWTNLFLALAHRRLGHNDQVQKYRRQALAAAGWEESVLQAQLLNELDDPVHEILAGRAKPAGAAQAIDLARRCGSVTQLYVAAARLYAEAFAADPRLAENLSTFDRYNAACCAALAAAGQGYDAAALSQPERARLRQQAHDWLRADLEHWRKTLGAGKEDGRKAVLQQMQHWQQDADLIGVRDKKALAALPEAERRTWEQLWAAVATLLDRAQKAK